MKTIGIIGTRSRDTEADYILVYEAFCHIYENGDRIVSGGCPQGGDHFANRIARLRGLTITVHYPDWGRYGKSAGFARNIKIAQDADILIACISKSRVGGTEDTIAKFQRLKPHGEVLTV